MKLSLVTVGTRGDAQPFVVLGRALDRRGFEVTVVTHTDFEDMVRGAGLDFAPVGGSFKQIIESEAGREWIESADSLRRYAETSRRTFGTVAEQWGRDIIAAVEQSDALVAHPFAPFGIRLSHGTPVWQRPQPAMGTPYFSLTSSATVP